MKSRLTIVAGARPNFMKIAPLIRALDERTERFEWRLVHTGQHFDAEMTSVFFQELGIPRPHASLNCGGGSAAEQTGKMLVALEREFRSHRPDCVIVVGDVTSTMAAALAAKKEHLTVAHIEGGLRSRDRRMPEEINRLVTDAISDLFFTTEPSGNEALMREGHAPERVRYVGNVMIDNLMWQYRQLREGIARAPLTDALKRELASSRYGVVTLHRPSNVDDRSSAGELARALRTVARELPLLFPMHPRTRDRFATFRIDLGDDVRVLPPLPYMEFLNLWSGAALVITDSGGLQEETTALGVPCVTARDTTERPVTIEQGTNVLAGTRAERIVECALQALRSPPAPRCPPLWDGQAARRIVADLAQLLTAIAPEGAARAA